MATQVCPTKQEVDNKLHDIALVCSCLTFMTFCRYFSAENTRRLTSSLSLSSKLSLIAFELRLEAAQLVSLSADTGCAECRLAFKFICILNLILVLFFIFGVTNIYYIWSAFLNLIDFTTFLLCYFKKFSNLFIAFSLH